MKRRAILLCALAAGIVFIGWFESVEPRMQAQLARCETTGKGQQISRCMTDHGWRFNSGLNSCDKGQVDDLGCYETPWTFLTGA